jgi:predicted O-methyltransferase YrrM
MINEIKDGWLMAVKHHFDFSLYYNSIDFIFIDGAHTYKHTLSDSANALKMLRNGCGVIVWHDYAGVWEGVVRALNRLYKTQDTFKDIHHIEGTSLAYLVRL